ncbi:MAG: tRNA (adenosine(37)-N6)-dimethylallyltransferase MiaA [Bradyrhizobiaceae bacterium]|nr:tRNA (adenosine(37)-N6)-dimethylallyltransferase MiaA [Bradyrhizobiaceae bacterium]
MRAVLIAGPTASGKSALALTLAEALGGVIVNTDSMQVYRDLKVITARPTAEDESRAPHLLYGHVDASENYSVGRFLVDARSALAEAQRLGRMPIFVGGTGLYFKALTHGLAAVPAIAPEIRARVRGRVEAEGPTVLYEELLRRDPAMARRLQPGDRTRIARALEVVEATGRSLSEWHDDGMPALLKADRVVRLFLTSERATLNRRIDARFDAMLTGGALDEVRALCARHLDPLLPAMKAHGVPWLSRYLAGEITLALAVQRAKQDTRHYAKRQFTWFRHQLGDWPRAAPDAAVDALKRALALRT